MFSSVARRGFNETASEEAHVFALADGENEAAGAEKQLSKIAFNKPIRNSCALPHANQDVLEASPGPAPEPTWRAQLR